jgi:hypothetical protein
MGVWLIGEGIGEPFDCTRLSCRISFSASMSICRKSNRERVLTVGKVGEGVVLVVTSVLKSGPVRSFGFFGQDRDRNRLPKMAGPEKPDCNRHGPVASGLGRSFAVAQPVATGFRLQPVATSLYRFNTGCNRFFEVNFIKYHVLRR